MKKTLITASFVYLLVVFAASAITVSAAASLKDALDNIVAAYRTEHTDQEILCNYGSSGSLQQQIENGAPVDLFISASERHMDKLQEKELLLNDTRVDLLKNKIVLIAAATQPDLAGVEGLLLTNVQSIAIGEMQTVPAGIYAAESLKALQLFDALQTKLIQGKDVRQVLTYVESGNVDAGFVFASDTKIMKNGRLVVEIPENLHSPIIYPAAIIRSSSDPEAARAFLSFLKSKVAGDIFHRYGFSVCE